MAALRRIAVDPPQCVRFVFVGTPAIHERAAAKASDLFFRLICEVPGLTVLIPGLCPGERYNLIERFC
jgi:hypothetical protein